MMMSTRLWHLCAALLILAAAVSAQTDPSADPSCPDAGAESHVGCEDPIKGGTPFDLWELARSWTPGFCASGGKKTCAKQECGVTAMVPALTLHGMWPSFSKPVAAANSAAAAANAAAAAAVVTEAATATARRALRDVSVSLITGAAAANAPGGACFWPQDCTQPGWWPASSPWTYDATLLPAGAEFETLAPAWYSDGLGAHEWPKHGTCAAWADAAGANHGLDQAGYYSSMFALAKKEGTPKPLLDAMGTAVPLADLQAMFGGAKRVALGCTPKCELVQVLTCYAQGKGTAGDPAGPGARADCPCTGVRDSHYDNSCAELHACAAVKVLSPEQSGCGGSGPEPGPGPGPVPPACDAGVIAAPSCAAPCAPPTPSARARADAFAARTAATAPTCPSKLAANAANAANATAASAAIAISSDA
eukprot:CAMPEP_0197576442 /NCGR_PEP_ID=MMETSP1326-20131121/1466_1 /TAXON_ID=1155430 /ORGANISM="Genus nov. species nov., Strain RCC2288" /LENGTH=420 /DNA_ID=CAMNT_0043139373 /DNA_START=69 /DNA_END=1332 /DNA_ORIENTATION=+